MPFLRTTVFVFAVLLVLTAVPRVALADPHAVFYTAIGQQQLFFNVLAALDQADYVEPFEQTTGIPAGYTRKELLEKRTNAGFGPVENLPLIATDTTLSTVLTRGVTLEGNDLWSSYLALQFARESARRNATDEIARVYCDRSLGRVGCSRDPNHAVRNTAFISNPIAWEREVLSEGILGSLFSGKDWDKALRKQRVSTTTKLGRQKPRAYSRFIAGLRERVKGDKNKEEAIERRLAKAASSFFYQGPDPTSYDDIVFKDYGVTDYYGDPVVEAELAWTWWNDPFYPPARKVSSIEYIDRAFSQSNKFDELDVALNQELRQGADFIKNFQRYITTDGAIADVVLQKTFVTPCYDGTDNDGDIFVDEEDPQCHRGGNSSFPYDYDRLRDEGGAEFKPDENTDLAELIPIIETPAHAKLAMAEGLADTIGDIDQNLMYVPPQAEQLPGDQQLVGPEKEPPPAGASSVRSLVDANSTTSGNVAGLTNTKPSGGDAAGASQELLAQNTASSEPSLPQQQGRVLQATSSTPPGTYPNYYDWYMLKNTKSRSPQVNPAAPHLEEGMTDALFALTGDRYFGLKTACGFCAFITNLINSQGWQTIIDEINKG